MIVKLFRNLSRSGQSPISKVAKIDIIHKQIMIIIEHRLKVYVYTQRCFYDMVVFYYVMRITWYVIVDPCVCQDKHRNHRGMRLMQDGATTHTGHGTLDFLQAHGVDVIQLSICGTLSVG